MGANASLILLLSMGAMASGTAGTWQITEPNPLEVRQFRFPVQEARSVASRRREHAPSAAESLRQIRDIFGLKMSELSQIFGVSRRAAYDWLDGAIPKPEMSAKIYQLSSFAAKLDEARVDNIRHFIHRPIVGERTLLELLKANEHLDRAIAVIQATAAEEANNRKPLTGRIQKTGDLDEVSTPIFE
jgi:hypothetical protein